MAKAAFVSYRQQGQNVFIASTTYTIAPAQPGRYTYLSILVSKLLLLTAVLYLSTRMITTDDFTF